jgi:hypothetical protein
MSRGEAVQFLDAHGTFGVVAQELFALADHRAEAFGLAAAEGLWHGAGEILQAQESALAAGGFGELLPGAQQQVPGIALARLAQRPEQRLAKLRFRHAAGLRDRNGQLAGVALFQFAAFQHLAAYGNELHASLTPTGAT